MDPAEERTHLIRRATEALRARPAWLVYGATALACTRYVNDRADLVPKWGQWYGAVEAGHPWVLLQVRAFLSGRLAILPNSLGGVHDCSWGRGGMHQVWGLGVPLIATPFHLLGRLFGAPGFPDDVRFLVLYAITCAVLARALHLSSQRPASLVPSAAAAGYVMVLPTFVGLLVARFYVFEQTIAMGVLWSVLLLAGTLRVLDRCTPARLAVLCAAAGFETLIRPPLAVYGATTVAIALLVAHRRGLRPRALAAGVGAYAATNALFLLGNTLRFGSPFEAGYATCLAGATVNRLNRWGLPFKFTPLPAAVKEMFATLFLIEPVGGQTMDPPPAVKPFVVGERWREYYAPTYDRVTFAVWLVAVIVVAVGIVRGRLWRRDRELGQELPLVVGAWALPPSLVLFLFYARVGNMVTRYATDMAPAFAASGLCVGMAIVAAVRKYAPRAVTSTQLAIAGAVALYMAGWPEWPKHMSTPLTRAEVVAHLTTIDGHAKETVPKVPNHFACGQPRGPEPVHTQFWDWHGDCTFTSGLVFAMPHDRCVSFTLQAKSGRWEDDEQTALAGFRAYADADPMVSCGAPVADGSARKVTLCDPHPPSYLLEGMRLYSLAALNSWLLPLDNRLKLMKVDAVSSCP